MEFIPRINFDCEKNCECENPIKPDWYAKCLDCQGWHCFKCGQRIDHEMKIPYKYRKYEEELALIEKERNRYYGMIESDLSNVTVIIGDFCSKCANAGLQCEKCIHNSSFTSHFKEINTEVNVNDDC